MQEQGILDGVVSAVCAPHRLHKYSLVCTEAALAARVEADIINGLRPAGALAQSIARLPNYLEMDTEKIDVSGMTAAQAAAEIYGRVCGGAGVQAAPL